MASRKLASTRSRLGRGLKLTPELRSILSCPLGPIYRGSEGIARLCSEVAEANPVKLIAVGDVVSAILAQKGIKADVYIIDHKIMRKPVKPIKLAVEKVVKARNPPGCVTRDAWSAVEAALKSEGAVLVEVDGEEDLLVIPSVMLAPTGSLVLYGQPRVGVVVLWVDEELKREVEAIAERMIP